jgi:basic amino acid/polyamine antiporter, APA family
MAKLHKTLGLRDVYAVSTGAMFSSGFFLLPGLAAAQAGPAVVFVYLLSALIMIPATLSVAELSTAMPRDGGGYFFIDRGFGPLAGMVAGLGVWFTLVFKSAFTLLGMGYYLDLFIELPIQPVAIGLAVLFTALNLFGAKSSTRIEQLLVFLLLLVLGYFLVEGALEIASRGMQQVLREQFVPLAPFGEHAVFSTIGLVFVSYVGVTQVSSIAQEVKDPSHTIPLGMILSLATAALFYVGGVFIMVAVLDPQLLQDDMTPVATAARTFMDRITGQFEFYLVIVAAIAAFISTANAGILAASRYPMAMALEKLLPQRFGRLNRFGIPTTGLWVTVVAIIGLILLLDAENMAKLGSAVQLLVFAMLNAVVIVMRQSGLKTYQPGYQAPLYPWLQLFGIIASLVLLVELGWLPLTSSGGLIVAGIIGYFLYARRHVNRTSALSHLFGRAERRKAERLEDELALFHPEPEKAPQGQS